MIKVVKGNVVLRVDDSMLDFYVNKGYTAKTLDGEIIKEAIPTDVNSLRKAYLQYKSEVKTLREKVKVLEEELASKKAQPKVTAQPVVQEGEPIEEKPKRTRRKLSEEE
jgi:hypothetical protein